MRGTDERLGELFSYVDLRSGFLRSIRCGSFALS
jgi:hypothetical protein